MICHNCQDKELAGLEIRACKEAIASVPSGLRALDIGCGDSGDGQKIFEDHIYTGIDKTTGTDARLLPFDDNSYDLVLMKRILCQNKSQDRRRIIQEAGRVCAPGGRLIVCEPWLTEYGNMNRLRAVSGLNPLIQPASGGNLLEDREFYGFKRVSDTAVAPAYVYWTRYLFELLTGRQMPYDQPIVRGAYPRLVQGAGEVAFYRVKVYQK